MSIRFLESKWNFLSFLNCLWCDFDAVFISFITFFRLYLFIFNLEQTFLFSSDAILHRVILQLFLISLFLFVCSLFMFGKIFTILVNKWSSTTTIITIFFQNNQHRKLLKHLIINEKNAVLMSIPCVDKQSHKRFFRLKISFCSSHLGMWEISFTLIFFHIFH